MQQNGIVPFCSFLIFSLFYLHILYIIRIFAATSAEKCYKRTQIGSKKCLYGYKKRHYCRHLNMWKE